MEPKTKKLYDLILSTVQPQRFYADHLAGQDLHWSFGEQMNVWCVFHPEAKAPSLAINKDGRFYCHSGGCHANGANIIQFSEQSRGTKLHATLEYLYGRYIRPTISERVAEQYHANLMGSPEMLQWIRDERGVTAETVSRYRIGFDNKRLTIPVHNEFGHLINIRRYDFTRTHDIKMLPYQPGYGGRALFPYEQIYEKDVILCEGEWDALVLIQNGFNAITQTAGVGAWHPEWTPLFHGKNVTVCFDVNDPLDAGQKCASRRGTQLAGGALSVRNLVLPLTETGGDVTDYFVKHHHTADDFKALLAGALPVLPEAGVYARIEVKADGTVITEVPLSEASKDQYKHQPIATRAVVVAKEDSPYLIPRHVKVSCPRALCAACPYDGRGAEVDLCSELRMAVDLVDVPTAKQKSNVRRILRVPDDCQAVIAELDGCNVEGLLVASDLDTIVGDAGRVKRIAYRLQGNNERGLQPNQTYRLEGTTTVNPKNQAVVHIVDKALPVQSAIETFRLTDEIKDQLAIFKTDNIELKLAELYRHYAVNVTRIFQRPDLHQACDLVFHSPLEFLFDSDSPRSGRLDVLIIGDTRTGKGFVAEGLAKFYRLGGVTSCEGASFAGLIGGNETVDGKRYMVWGKVPMYDRRLLVLDEASALADKGIFQQMSRVRSEGKVEITKICTEETLARTRLLWIANCLSGKPLSAYNTGVEAIAELVGRAEDIARFDYALAVAGNEVPSKVINSRHPSRVKSPYTAEVCRNLVLWVWSRTAKQVVFEEDATGAVLTLARELGARYSPIIPLVQSENIRLKLAKIAAALAGRTFSSDPSGENLVVTRACVEAAYRFLNHLYTKPSMGYSMFSNANLDRDRLRSKKELTAKVDELGDRALDFVEGCLEQSRLSMVDFMDYTGNTKEWAQSIVSFLVREHAVKKDGLEYVKKPAFIEFLREARERYKMNGSPRTPTF